MKIAVLIPCYNEELTITKVVEDFKKYLPAAEIYVYDNNSKDKTNQLAMEAGAIVKKEFKQGKGNVVRSMFRDIDADIYIMIDGDDTYPVEEVQKMIEPILNKNADMVIGDRLSNGTYSSENKRNFHDFGNKLVLWLINQIFKSDINDIMTGYRAFSKRFVKCIPIMSDGFQIETEMSIYSLANGMNIVEVPITYRDRPEGSESKLNTFKDGFKVLLTIFDLFKNYKPLIFFGSIGLIIFILALIAGVPVILEFGATHFVSKIPSAVLAAALMILSVLSFVLALIFDAIKNQTRIMMELNINQFISRENKNEN